jgi:hypothetical protein
MAYPKARTMAWSSTIRTRIFAMVLLLEGDVHVDRGSASQLRLGRDGAVQKGRPFADVDQAQTFAGARRLEQCIAVEPTSVVFPRQIDIFGNKVFRPIITLCGRY